MITKLLIKYKKYIPYIKWGTLLLLICFPLFYALNVLPIRIWDEGRTSMNAYEMYKNGNYIVSYFNGAPEMWNSKPPFVLWNQVLWMHLIGVNEWAIRMPSALAGLFTCLVLVLFCERVLKSFFLGFITVLVLVTANGYIDEHVTRTGDFDAMLTLFTTSFSLVFFTYLERKQTKYLYLFFLLLALAALTKGIAAFLFLPAIFVYTLLLKQVLPLLKNKHLYIGICILLALVSSFYLLREHYNPGYLQIVYANEFGLYKEVQDERYGKFSYYFKQIIELQFSIWYLFVPFGVMAGLMSPNKLIKKITLYCFLIAPSFLIIISVGQTKLPWYDAPSFPIMSLLVAIFIKFFIDAVVAAPIPSKLITVKPLLPYCMLAVILIIPYSQIARKVYRPVEFEWDYEFFKISNYLKAALNGETNVNGKKVIFDRESYYNNLMYMDLLQKKGINISELEKEKIKINDIVVISQDSTMQYINNHFIYQPVDSFKEVGSYKIIGLK